MLNAIVNVTPFAIFERADGVLPGQICNILRTIALQKALCLQGNLDRDSWFSPQSCSFISGLDVSVDLKMCVNAENMDFAAVLRPFSCTLVKK